MMQDKLTRAIKVMHGWHKLSGILGGKIYPRKVHLFPLRHIHIGRNAIAKKYANIYNKTNYSEKVHKCYMYVKYTFPCISNGYYPYRQKRKKSKSIISKLAKMSTGSQKYNNEKCRSKCAAQKEEMFEVSEV